MLTPKQLQEIVETMQPLLDDLNVWITKDIIRRIVARMSRGEDWSFGATDISQAQVFRDLGGHFEALQRQLMAFTQAAEDEVRKIFQYTGLTAYDADAEMYRQGGLDVPPLRQSPRILQILEDTYRRTNGEVRNFTRTTATATQQRLIQALDKAHIMVMSGATSYATAVKEIVDELAEHQAYVRYPTGHTDTLEVAVLRAVRTGTAQASGNMSIGTMEQYGWEIVLTSAHLGARYGDGGENPGNHFWWQGRFFSRTGKDPRFPPFIESTGYGTGEGLCGWNCRHSFGPGDGKHNPWKQYDKEENKKAYDISQAQRKQERDIRKQKRKVMALKEAIDNCDNPGLRQTLQETYNAEYDKLGNMNARYNSFCDENGVPRLADRLQVAEWNYKEVMHTYKESSNADNSSQNASGAKKTPGWQARHAKLYYKEVIAIFKNNAVCWETTPSVTYGDSIPRVCRPILAENCPADSFPGARILGEGAFWLPRINFDDCYRNRKEGVDASKIAKYTDFTTEQVEDIRQHMFLRIQPLDNGTVFERFYPDYDQAQAWQRLSNY